MKKRYGENKVINISTFKTEGGKSAILTACRGLKINNDDAQYIANLIPRERGLLWSLKDCFEGNEEKERKPATEFINKVNEYEGLKEIALSLEGLVVGRSIHASGVYVFNNHYLDNHGIMKAPNGQLITCWNMEDSDYAGGLKQDMLTIEALDKIRVSMELLLKYGFIEWQGSLKATYDTYFHPDNLDYDNEEIYKTFNRMMDLFQFETPMGQLAIKTITPHSIRDLANGNSLMRLAKPVDEKYSPMEIYAIHKSDISIWYKEMENSGLSKEDVSIIEPILKKVYGVADTQEVVMNLAMRVGFDVLWANKLRKAIAKKKPKVLEEVKQRFFEIGLESHSEALLNYLWYVQFKRLFGYGFSCNHSYPYSVIGFQEATIFCSYPEIIWNCACLSVNSGALESVDEDSKEKNTSYGKIASAIGKIQKEGVKVTPPYINEAQYGFKPNLEHNNIVYGLKGLTGLNKEKDINLIIENAPYSSFKDFYERLNLTKVPTMNDKGKMINKSPISNAQCASLIKAGAFDKIEEGKTREQLMWEFMKLSDKVKQCSLKNIEDISNNIPIPEEFEHIIRINNFRKFINGFKKFKLDEEDKKANWITLFHENNLANERIESIMDEYFMSELKEDYYDYNEQGHMILNIGSTAKGSFESIYKEIKKPIDKWLKTKEVKDKYIENQWLEKWDNLTGGKVNISKWEMDSLSFYFHEHELSNVDKEKYDISNFYDLEEEPIRINDKDEKYAKYELSKIIGTVIDKNKDKKTVTLLTPNGVVPLKIGGRYFFYDKEVSVIGEDGGKVKIESGWFKRGNHLMVMGFRSGDNFIVRKYRESIERHSLMKINDYDEQGKIYVQTDRASA